MAAEQYFGVSAAGMFYVGSKAVWSTRGGKKFPRAGWNERRSRRCRWWRRSARGGSSLCRPNRTSAAIVNSAMCAGLRWRGGSVGGGRMNFTTDQLDAVDVTRRHLDTLRGGRAWVGEDHRPGGVLSGALWREGVDPLRILAITFTEKAAGKHAEEAGAGIQNDSEIRGRTRACLGLDRPRILRAPVAGECRLCGSRPGVPQSWRGTKRGPYCCVW